MIANILIAVSFFSLGFIIGGAIGISKKDEKPKPNEKEDIVIWIDGYIYADKD